MLRFQCLFYWSGGVRRSVAPVRRRKRLTRCVEDTCELFPRPTSLAQTSARLRKGRARHTA
eukprot:2529961-Amphidinium_carterae.1